MTKRQPSPEPEEKKAVVQRKGPGGELQVAAGKGRAAEEMVRLARQAEVEVRTEGDPLKRILDGAAETQIPQRIYEVVAEVIQFTFDADEALTEGTEPEP